ncbi:MAG: glycosyltransferase family 2 protein [Planctomycetes bacterium]|nr:glycosyltransferase family 2 protein [Planctomycetota bacterium]
MSAPLELSVVIPVYRSAETLRELVERLTTVLGAAAGTPQSELVFAVDASPDDSLERLAELQRSARGDTALRVLVGARNVGQHAALRAGFRAARGRALLVLDADLQYAPEEVPRFLEAWRGGADLVAGWRRSRSDAYFARVLPSALFNAFARWWSGVSLRDFGCGFCLLDARLVTELERGGARRRFLKPLLGALAHRAVELEVASAPRAAPSAYDLRALARLALWFAVGWSPRPFGALSVLGLLLGACAVLEVGSCGTTLAALGAALFASGALGLAWHRALQREPDPGEWRELSAP